MMSTERVSSCALPSPCWKYDVFLSFRGKDTRKNFTDHLYTALNQKGINVFKDEDKLERGESISPELFKAIEESRCLIIVFSRNYADSTWCLDELVKILECKNKSISQQFIFPIFYDVKPTVVRKQTAKFKKAFKKYEKVFQQNMQKVQKWRDGLKEVANISGWELKNRNESEFIENIVKDVSSKLIPTKFETHKCLVGINSRLEKLRLLLGKESSGVRMIGICGMGGVGKTTIARVIFDLISGEFEGSSFLADVREISEKGNLISLQKQLLSDLLKLKDSNIWNVYEGINMIESRLQRKKVLLVIDDVADPKQLEGLAGQHCWFGSGSRIIITSRDKHLLKTHEVDDVHELEELNDDESLQLFYMKAFKSHQPLEGYEHLCNRFAKCACGLPLALKVWGSFLYGRTVEEWGSALQSQERDPTNQIMKILEISFNGLQKTAKKIFLDIACFFKGEDKDYVTKILEGCDFNAIIGIPVLIEKSLISISDDNRVWVHDLLQEMGQLIVERESDERGKRSRLWEEKIIRHVLSENKGTELIEGILLNNWEHDEAYSGANANSFSKMTNLRLLRIPKVKLPEGLDYLSNELRLLEWHGYPLESLPSNLQLDKVVDLSICSSNIKQMLNTIKPLNNLKFMRFNHSQNLMRTPDFTGIPNLEKLILIGCKRLHEIHQSLLVHKKLEELNLEDCTSLTTLPSKIHMGSLKKLVLSRCSKLRKFPEIVGSMECLSELLLDGTSIKELPSSVELLSGLTFLDLKDCKSLVRLPSTINGLKTLKTLSLSGCSKLENVPENLGEVKSLEELDISGTAIIKPTSCIFQLKNLKSLSFRGCKASPTSTSWFSFFPINLIPRRSSDVMGLVLSSLSGLSSLTKLNLSDCNLGEGAIPNDICDLLSLRELNLSRNNFVSLPGNLNRLSNLGKLRLVGCKRLQSLQLPCHLWSVSVDGCTSLERVLSSAVNSFCQMYFTFSSVNCPKLLGNNSWVSSMLKYFFEIFPGSSYFPAYCSFGLVFSGSKIPEWFKYQNEGSTVKIIGPPDYYYENKSPNKFKGYVICCVFHVPAVKRWYNDRTAVLGCHLKSDKHDKFSAYVVVDVGQRVSEHIWLTFMSSYRIKDDNFEISFEPIKDGRPGIFEVKSCGVHPIYVDEVKEFDKTTEESITSKVWNINEYESHQVFVESPMNDAPTTSKRSFTEYTEANVADEDSQPNKRFKEVE